MDQLEIEKIYVDMIDSWNCRDAKRMASLFADQAFIVGFDGSHYVGRAEFRKDLERIFAHHGTASYVWDIREIYFLTPGVCLMQAAVGMIPPGSKDIDPSLNAIQSLVFHFCEGWEIALLQNTPAQFHGRPEAAEELTRELRERIPVAG